MILRNCEEKAKRNGEQAPRSPGFVPGGVYTVFLWWGLELAARVLAAWGEFLLFRVACFHSPSAF